MKDARRNRANWLNTLTASLRRETLRQELSTGVVKSLTTAEAPTDRVPQALATARDLLAFSTRESFIYFQQLHLSSTKHLFGPPTIHDPVFVRTTRAVHNKHTEAARECSQFEAGTPNVAMSVDCSSPPCRPAEIASFARLSTARRVSFTIVAHPITKPATPTVPDDNPKRAMTMNAACKAEVVRTAPKSEISAAAAKEPRDV